MKLECGLSEEEFAELLSVIASQSSIEQAVLFGSRAKGTYKPGSDVDIIDYNTIDNAALRDHIDRVGKVIFSRRT